MYIIYYVKNYVVTDKAYGWYFRMLLKTKKKRKEIPLFQYKFRWVNMAHKLSAG